MIRSFRHKGLKRLYDDADRSRLPADMIDRIELILGLLDSVEAVKDMDLPGFRLHQLKGDRKGRWAVTVRANWRITFSFDDGDASDVEFEDYH